MAIHWGTFKNQIIAGIINDPDGTRVTPEQLLVYARWACVEISYHTAQAISQTWTCDGLVCTFPIPDDSIDDIEKVGLVQHVDTKNVNILPPQRFQPDMIWPATTEISAGNSSIKSYWEWPTGTLELGFIPPVDTKIVLNYFRTWTAPENDDSVLDIPRWMEHPIGYMIAAYSLDPVGYQITNIRNWNRKLDQGQPEDNPPHRQAEFYLRQADRLLSRIAPQDRETFYRMDNNIGVRRNG